jgi:hypothetical protein
LPHTFYVPPEPADQVVLALSGEIFRQRILDVLSGLLAGWGVTATVKTLTWRRDHGSRLPADSSSLLKIPPASPEIIEACRDGDPSENPPSTKVGE